MSHTKLEHPMMKVYCRSDFSHYGFRALSIRPDPKVVDQLGMMYFHSGRKAESLAVYEEMIDRSSNNTDALLHYVCV